MNVIPEPVSFDELGVSVAMQNTVAELGYTMATPIQTGSLPFAMAGRDVIGQAQTGSGKTAAFGIPIIERLDPRDGPVQALVLCPTRELAVQVHDELTRLGKRHELRSVAIYGGDSIGRQMEELRQGAHIVVANYEMLDHFAPSYFSGIILDESSILKAQDGKTRTHIIEVFGKTPYRLACSATPAPNDYMELGNHSQFLGIM